MTAKTLRESLYDDPVFVRACRLAKVEITTRQLSKYRNGYGAAYRLKNEAIYLIAEEAKQK